ncbi:MAG: DoxX family protein [Acetobacteraceae bacterium]|nr:DoxX family protein [Acetobacteraceae bacterium]MBV8525745.1 DoxX family protein [Acetobacteraceae bacterium]
MLSILRIMTALLFIEHGTQKLFGFPPPLNPGPGLPPLLWVQGIIELVGGLLILFGLFTRPAAFILAGDMAVAYFMVHAPRGFFPVSNQGELAVLYCFVFLYLWVAGGGAWSIMRLRRANRLA